MWKGTDISIDCKSNRNLRFSFFGGGHLEVRVERSARQLQYVSIYNAKYTLHTHHILSIASHRTASPV